MYPYRPLCILVFAVLLLTGCAGKKEDVHTDHNKNAWEEMDNFHVVMAETFHPYKDSSNLEPAKRRATELMLSAQAWASAPLPDNVNERDMQNKLEKLKAEAEVLAEHAKSADDNVVAEQLTQVHDTFHEIQEAWYEAQ